ncbi:S41 family peptidase [Fulvivirga sedimenti]|uniref:S41 family peptidase n=1 Tax=Fulvivirga sedimenti TaxID=2879465 RepID=A0A9X1HWG4_9BACT|nr:S41 family peptidase [Fulvivirga sedimenti]MCA6075282.1 S41 family peptidase [Fulvivirga sedimenti]MCA6076459.1 S41 family peptidase [Fulvivirga sedimenti]MCA6077587.1 S41 family peptidase [Fulvivirga sedimenti]
MRTSLRKMGWVFALAAAPVIFFSFNGPDDRYFDIARNLDIFATLYKEVNALYVDEVNPNTLMRSGIDAMLASLDPYTNYIPEDDIEDFRTQSSGEYGGIGAVTGRINGKVKVIMLMDGYSAQKNGLKIGDEVIAINGVSIENLSRDETNELMKGQSNKDVEMTVRRYNTPTPIKLTFKREKVKIENVPYFGMVTADIGMVKLTEFTDQAGRSVKNAVQALKEKGAKKIILDLRGNPGGLLLEAVNTTNVFIPKGMDVVSTKGKIEDNNQTYKTLDNPVDTEIPLAVLINSGSASASEIVAGTLQDYDRAVIVGEKSFGKGLVQVSRPLSYNSQLKVTTAKYYTPSGRCIQALDYSHRRPDGSVGKIPDSLKTEFTTKNGRKVFDGGGIDPDISVEGEDISAIAYVLQTKGILFDYATRYYYDNPEIPAADQFSLSDKEYEAFKSWLKTQDYSYRTQVEKNLEDMIENASDEKYYDLIKDQLNELEEVIEQSKEKDLDLYKSQIKTLLEEEIAGRYYLERGSIESTFDADPDLQAAVRVLSNTEELGTILNKK